MDQEIFSIAFEFVNIGLLVVSPEGLLLECNKYWLDIVGYSVKEMVNSHIYNLTHPDDIPMNKIYFQQLLSGEADALQFEKRYIHKLGHVVWAKLHTKLVRDANNKPLYFVTTVQDISKQKSLEEALEIQLINVSKGVSISTGTKFFNTLVEFLAKTLNADFVLIGEHKAKDPNYVQTIAICDKDQIIDNFRYPIKDTPCDEVLKSDLRLFPNNIQKLYPKDRLLTKFNIESYAGTPLFDSNGKVLGLIVALFHNPIVDINLVRSMLQIFAVRAASELERKHSEQSLKESEERFRQLSEAAFEGIAITHEGSIIDINNRLAEVLGYSVSEIIGKPVLDLVAPESHEMVKQQQASGSEDKYQHLARRKDGSTFPLEAQAKYIPYQGKLMRVTAVRDITEMKREEEIRLKLQNTIEKAAQEWKETFDIVGSPILILDANGTISRVNLAAKNLLKRENEELNGINIDLIGNNHLLKNVKKVVKRVKNSHAPVLVQIKDEATGKTWDIIGNLSNDENIENRKIILVLNDISRIVKLQESLRRSEIMSALGTLVAGVAHEVRNPLFGLLATLDAFEVVIGSNSEYRAYLDILRKELQRLETLMQELFEYGKPASLDFTEVSLVSVVNEAIQQCEILSSQQSVNIFNKIDNKLPLILFDRKRIVHVFKNLIENAIQHSPIDSTITVSAEVIQIDEESWIQCVIKDCGNGFQKEDLTKIFEPFFTRRRGGTGLGLSIVQRIVEEHQGKIKAANHPRGGAVITVQFPFAIHKEPAYQ